MQDEKNDSEPAAGESVVEQRFAEKKDNRAAEGILELQGTSKNSFIWLKSALFVLFK